MTLDEFTPNNLYEMSNFGHRTTGLPSSIEIWMRTETKKLQHNNYRIKIDKNHEYAAIFSVEQYPKILKHSHKNSLTASEIKDISTFISTFSGLIIGHIDGKLDSGEFGYYVMKNRGS